MDQLPKTLDLATSALIFEGIPFVLLGSLISGIIAAFIPSRVITGLLPKNRLVATLVSGLLGIIFPVCECGIVPIVRRLLHKGLPLSCGVTYMLASPMLVILRTRRSSIETESV